MVLKPGREDEAEAIFHKWELDFAVIGEVTDTGHMVLEWQGEMVCDIPLGPLADDAPLYDRPHRREEYKAWAKVKPLGEVPESTDIGADLLKLMASPRPRLAAAGSGSNTTARWAPTRSSDRAATPAVVRVHGTNKALAITTDCTPRYCYADPYEGGKQAIAEAYRNLCAVGARPLAVTNCLNFANPQRPEIMAQLVGCLEGMGEACRALDFPIVSGNVSLYNESKATGGGSAILPTPAIGGVGIIDDYARMATIAFKAEGEAILAIGPHYPELGQSLWLREIHGREDGEAPRVDLADERLNGEIVRKLIAEGKVTAVHDISDGGLLVAVAEMALAGGIGAKLDAMTSAFALNESQGRYLVTVAAGVELDRAEVPFERIGTTGGAAVEVGPDAVRSGGFTRRQRQLLPQLDDRLTD